MGLFGQNPYDSQAAEQAAMDKQAMDMAKMSQDEMSSYAMAKGGLQIGKAGRSLLGIEDPALKELAIGKEMLNGVDQTDPKALKELAKAYGAKGMHRFGEEAYNKAVAIEKEQGTLGKTQAEIDRMKAQAEAAKRGYGKINPQMYTPESLAKFKESNDFADLELNPKAAGSVKAQSPAGRIAADRGFTPGTTEFADEVRKVEAELKQAETVKAKAKSLMPAAVVKVVDELQGQVDVFNNNIQDIDGLVKLMNDNNVKFSPGDNLESFLKTVFNNSDEAARVKSDLRTTVEGMRNAILQGNKGTQTEGDADRAAAEVLSALDKNDTAVVFRRLTTLKTKFERAMEQRKGRINSLTGRYGEGATPPAEEPQPAAATAPQPTPIQAPAFSVKDATPATVKAAFKAGKMSREAAKAILKDLEAQKGTTNAR